MKALIAASGLLLVAATSAEPLAQRPPEEFTGNKPKSIAVFYTEPAIVHAACARLLANNPPEEQLRPGWVIRACTTRASRVSIMPDPCLSQYAGESFAALACHEKGHANGWGWEYG